MISATEPNVASPIDGAPYLRRVIFDVVLSILHELELFPLMTLPCFSAFLPYLYSFLHIVQTKQEVTIFGAF
uniref:Uncharacterized protein n=1 Tax=Heterorhabditis bacteriophora TaxID=37862 RepID=A0A1I7X320_HETBA